MPDQKPMVVLEILWQLKGFPRDCNWMVGGSWDFSWSCVNNYTIFKYIFVWVDRTMEIMMQLNLPPSPNDSKFCSSQRSSVWLKPRMRDCRGCNHTPLMLRCPGNICFCMEQWQAMWRNLLPALGSLWRYTKKIGTELKSCQKHWSWFFLTLLDLAKCSMSALFSNRSLFIYFFFL